VPAAPAHPPPVLVHVLGASVRGRPIRAYEVGATDARRKVLVIGCIHGNEPAGIAIADRLATLPPLSGVDLWIVPDLNPDGVAANTRQNARGVDLNRNFPWHWLPLGPPGTTYYAGAHALSEPESRIAYHLVLRLRPAVAIWFHQHLDLVDESGRSVAVERRFAAVARLPLQRLVRYPGSATTWEDHAVPRGTAFVVELGPGRLAPAAVARFARAARAAAR
jgi:murein peptide amidase A